MRISETNADGLNPIMDWEEFHHKAKGVLPSQPLPPKRYWIGVLLHDRLLTDDFQETDFVWMKAHGVSGDISRNTLLLRKTKRRKNCFAAN